MKTLASDRALRDAVQSELEWDPAVDATHVGVSAKDGGITLTGRVASHPQKVAAVQAAERVHGVAAVADELAVEDPASAAVDDSALAEVIARLLRWNSALPGTVEAAEVADGHVTLRGEVDWAYQRDELERAVENVPGVRGVTNEIRVVSPPLRDDPASVRRRVEDALERTADLDGSAIRVDTGDGTVRLLGQVRSAEQRRLAEQVAAAAPGATTVENALAIVADDGERGITRSR